MLSGGVAFELSTLVSSNNPTDKALSFIDLFPSALVEVPTVSFSTSLLAEDKDTSIQNSESLLYI